MLIIHSILLYRANHMTSVELSIDNSMFEIAVGDIFEEGGCKIIAFNEYFDTRVDDKIISSNTLNGKYIKKFYPYPAILDEIIENDTHARQAIIEYADRKPGKTEKYKLGTIVENGEYFLLAFTHFDKDNKAYLEMDDYLNCLMNMWKECNTLYQNRTIVLPLFGSGITRFNDHKDMGDQDLVEMLIWTFKLSPFRPPAKVKLVIHENNVDNINFYEIKKHFGTYKDITVK